MTRISDGPAPGEDLESFIRQLCRKGITLWTEENVLRYRAPKGVLTDDERRTLNQTNDAIASLLERQSCRFNVGSPLSRHSRLRRAPLSPTQLGYWHDRLEYGSQPIRHIASVTRLEGRLRIDLLSESLKAIVRRHEALRTRIVLCDGDVPLQEVADEYRSDLEVISLLSIPEFRRQAEIEHQIERAIVEAENYAASPLFKAVLLSVAESENLLILALDHMISDLTSLNLLFEEILTAYTHLLKGDRIALPPIGIQFPDYSVVRCAEFADFLRSPGRRFDSVGRTCLPDDTGGTSKETRMGWGLARFTIGRGTRDELREFARSRGTTMVIATLAAYAISVIRLCGVRETVIPFVTDGRMSPELERTIGFFAFPIYIRTVLSDRITFSEFLMRVTEDYCRACDEADFGCTLARIPRPQFICNPWFNWLPAGAVRGSVASESAHGLVLSPVEFTNPLVKLLHLDAEPSVSFTEQDGAIICQLHYPLGRFSGRSMEKFATTIQTFLTTLIRTPTRRVMDVDLT